MPWTHEEHTADLAIRARGATLPEAVGDAARGLVAAMLDLEAVRAEETLPIEGEGDDLPLAVYRFLEEVRFLVETGFVPCTFRVRIEGTRVVAEAKGEAYEATRHGHLHEVKAVTLHHLRVVADPPEIYYVVDI